MVYPTVADLYARSNLSNMGLPERYSIQKSKVNSTLSKNISLTIQKCLMNFCNVTSGCVEGLKEWDTGSMSTSPSNIASTFYVSSTSNTPSRGSRFDFCDYVPGSFNQDIGGIGVREYSVGLDEI